MYQNYGAFSLEREEIKQDYSAWVISFNTIVWRGSRLGKAAQVIMVEAYFYSQSILKSKRGMGPFVSGLDADGKSCRIFGVF